VYVCVEVGRPTKSVSSNKILLGIWFADRKVSGNLQQFNFFTIIHLYTHIYVYTLRMFVYVYAYILYINYVYVYTYIYMYLHISTYILYVCICIHIYNYIYIYMCVCILRYYIHTKFDNVKIISFPVER